MAHPIRGNVRQSQSRLPHKITGCQLAWLFQRCRIAQESSSTTWLVRALGQFTLSSYFTHSVHFTVTIIMVNSSLLVLLLAAVLLSTSANPIGKLREQVEHNGPGIGLANGNKNHGKLSAFVSPLPGMFPCAYFNHQPTPRSADADDLCHRISSVLQTLL